VTWTYKVPPVHIQSCDSSFAFPHLVQIDHTMRTKNTFFTLGVSLP